MKLLGLFLTQMMNMLREVEENIQIIQPIILMFVCLLVVILLIQLIRGVMGGIMVVLFP